MDGFRSFIIYDIVKKCQQSYLFTKTLICADFYGIFRHILLLGDGWALFAAKTLFLPAKAICIEHHYIKMHFIIICKPCCQCIENFLKIICIIKYLCQLFLQDYVELNEYSYMLLNNDLNRNAKPWLTYETRRLD